MDGSVIISTHLSTMIILDILLYIFLCQVLTAVVESASMCSIFQPAMYHHTTL